MQCDYSYNFINSIFKEYSFQSFNVGLLSLSLHILYLPPHPPSPPFPPAGTNCTAHCSLEGSLGRVTAPAGGRGRPYLGHSQQQDTATAGTRGEQTPLRLHTHCYAEQGEDFVGFLSISTECLGAIPIIRSGQGKSS